MQDLSEIDEDESFYSSHNSMPGLEGDDDDDDDDSMPALIGRRNDGGQRRDDPIESVEVPSLAERNSDDDSSDDDAPLPVRVTSSSLRRRSYENDSSDSDEGPVPVRPRLRPHPLRVLRSNVRPRSIRVRTIAYDNNDDEDDSSYVDDDDSESAVSIPDLMMRNSNDESSGYSMPALMLRAVESSDDDVNVPVLRERGSSDDDDSSSEMPRLLPRNGRSADEDESDSSSIPNLRERGHQFSSDEDSIPPLMRRHGRESDEDDSSSSSGSLPPLLPRAVDASSSDEDEPRWKLGIEDFPQLVELSDDVIINILSFVGTVPFEQNFRLASRHLSREGHYYATLVHDLPLVSQQFKALCDRSVNYMWKEGLMRLLKAEPNIWRKGLCRLIGMEDDGEEESVVLLERVFEIVKAENYRELFRSILQGYIRIAGPVLRMPASVVLDRPIHVRVNGRKYLNLIRHVMDSFPEEARQGREIEPLLDGSVPTFIFAHTPANIGPGCAACVAQIVHCAMQEDGSANVSFVPTEYLRLEKDWQIEFAEEEESMTLASAVRLGRSSANSSDFMVHRYARHHVDGVVQVRNFDQGMDENDFMEFPEMLQAMIAHIAGEVPFPMPGGLFVRPGFDGLRVFAINGGDTDDEDEEGEDEDESDYDEAEESDFGDIENED